ncbi:MAG: hypothetical protein U0350_09525 [Caldilineaceae bacterium]
MRQFDHQHRTSLTLAWLALSAATMLNRSPESITEAQGTAAKPVIFTSEADNGSGQQSGKAVHRGDGHLNYTTVRYAGWNAINLTVTLVRTGGQVFIENSSFMDDSGFGMVISAKQSIKYAWSIIILLPTMLSIEFS